MTIGSQSSATTTRHSKNYEVPDARQEENRPPESIDTGKQKKPRPPGGEAGGGSFTEAIIKCIRWTLVPRER